MFDSVIRAGAVVDRAILDKRSKSAPNAIVGMGSDYDTPNKQEPSRLNTGIHGRRQARRHSGRRAHRPQRQDR
jgi:hypothetical protein